MEDNIKAKIEEVEIIAAKLTEDVVGVKIENEIYCGKSAYEIALSNGYIGTEDEWLKSLKGVDGKDGHTPIKGIDYTDGKDGHTPVKGIDYFDGINGKDGYTPVKGVDYVDGKDGYTPVKGKDYFDGKDGKNGTDGKDYVITQTDYDAIAAKVTVPKKTSELTNDSGFITNSDIPTIPTKTSQLNNDSGYITSSAIPTVPTKTSQLTNDSNFITSASVPTDSHINDLIDAKLGVIENGSY